MVRGKTQMKRIENDASRQVTFSKRRNGLLKKAFELSVLCDAEVALIIFSPSGKLYEFASSRSISTNRTIDRYQRHMKDLRGASTPPSDENLQHWKEEAVALEKKIKSLEASRRKMTGEGLETCDIEELQQLENQLDKSLSLIRARKNSLFRERIQKLKEQEKLLREENAKLKDKVAEAPPSFSSKEGGKKAEQRAEVEVETELFIGPPEGRVTCCHPRV